MGGLINFVADNYIWFIVIAVILIFALIGYIVDATSKPKESKKENVVIEVKEDKPLNEIVQEKPVSEKEIKKEMYDEPLIIDEMPNNEENKPN